VHYTSGSTGRPKGIVVSLRSAFVRAASFLDDWAMDASDRLLAVTPPSAGSGLAFVIAALLSGARLLVASLAADGAAAVLRLARREAVTIVVAGPSLTGMLLRLDGGGGAFAHVRMLRVGAAGIRAQELAGWRVLLPPDCAVSHTYASTEAMIIASWTIPAGYAGAEPYLPVGRILTRVDCRLMDEDGVPVGAGEIGEMVVSGRDVALGEWREGRLVAGRVGPDPARPGWRVFRTGDLMRLGADGLLRFVCRADRQIKINGVRIEPGEIEAALRREPGVADAAVAGRTIDGRMVLEAFVAAPDCDAAALRSALQARLRGALVPAMRPSRLLVLAALARLPGGKVDLVGMRRVADGGAADG